MRLGGGKGPLLSDTPTPSRARKEEGKEEGEVEAPCVVSQLLQASLCRGGDGTFNSLERSRPWIPGLIVSTDSKYVSSPSLWAKMPF